MMIPDKWRAEKLLYSRILSVFGIHIDKIHLRHDLPASASSFAERPNFLRQHLPEYRAPRERISARGDVLRHHLPARQTPCVAISGRCVMIWLIVRQHLLSRPSVALQQIGALNRVAHNVYYGKSRRKLRQWLKNKNGWHPRAGEVSKPFIDVTA